MAHFPGKPTKPIESVGFLLIPGFSLMSYAAAVEPLRAANTLAGRVLYRWFHATPSGEPAAASNGAAIMPDYSSNSRPDNLDLMMVCAGGNPTLFNDKRSIKWLRRLASAGVALGGLSGGTYLLARAGLLEGRRCTLHWEHAPAFQEAFPDIELTRSLFELDGNRMTCSGGIAGLDMMVALITRDHGHRLGAAVADWFLHTQLREGTGPQRMDLRARLGIGDEPLLRTLRAMEGNLESPLTRQELATLAGASLRQLERSFRRQLGCGVHEHYLGLRLSRAQQLLRETSMSQVQISIAAGFASPSQYSRAFTRVVGVTPQQYRADCD